MTSPPKIDRLMEEAERIKKKEKREREREVKRNQPRIERSLDPDGIRITMALYPHRPSVLWVFGLLLAASGFATSLIESLFSYDRTVFGALTALFILYGVTGYWVRPFAWAIVHRGWRGRLPFTLQGWEICACSDRLLDSWEWRNISVTIHGRSDNALYTKAVEAALTVFVKQGNDRFYAAEGGEPRRRALTATATGVSGSMNAQILGLLAEFLRGPLAHIARTTSARVTATLKPDGNFFRVKGEPLGFT